MADLAALEWCAAALGIVNVVLVARQKVANYPFGIAMVLVYAYVFFQAKLYSEAALQVAWVFMQLHGWWFWLHGSKAARDGVPVTLLGHSGRVWTGVAIMGVTLLLGTASARWTDTPVPYQDALVTALSLAAQALLNWKKLESWLLWIFIDVFSVGLYASRGLHVTAGLYAVFLVLAVGGLVAWDRSRRMAQGTRGPRTAPA